MLTCAAGESGSQRLPFPRLLSLGVSVTTPNNESDEIDELLMWAPMPLGFVISMRQRLREYREANYFGGIDALRKVVPNAGRFDD